MNDGDARMAPGTTMALVAMGLGVLVIANDFTALNVGAAAIEQDFDVDVGTAQWVINAYALTFGMVIVTGGASLTCSGAGASSSSGRRSSPPSPSSTALRRRSAG